MYVSDKGEVSVAEPDRFVPLQISGMPSEFRAEPLPIRIVGLHGAFAPTEK
jgi:hypothetical protein